VEVFSALDDVQNTHKRKGRGISAIKHLEELKLPSEKKGYDFSDMALCKGV